MAKFTASVPLNIKWNGLDIAGAVGATHRIPDAFLEEFIDGPGRHIAGLTWITQDETSAIPSIPLAQSDVTGLTTSLASKFDKAGGTIDGSVTVTGTLAGSSTITAPRIGGAIYADRYSSLQAAVTAGAGNRVVVPAGTYTLSSSLSVGTANTIIEGVGPESVIDGSSLVAGTHAIFTAQSGVSFRNFKVIHGTQNAAIRIDGDDVRVEGVTVIGGLNGVVTQGKRTRISGCYISSSTSTAGGFGVLASPAADGLIATRNHIVASRIGIAANESTRFAVISANVISACTEIGIDLDGDAITFVGGFNAIVGNTIEQSGSSAYGGIFVGESRDNTIIGNVSRGSPAGSGIRVVTTSPRNVISGNTLASNAKAGILLSDGDDSVVSGNSAYGNGEYGIDVNASDNVVIVGNRIMSNGTSGAFDGIRFSTGAMTGGLVSGNIITGNTRYGVNISASAVSSVTTSGNIYQSNTSGDLADSGTGSSLEDYTYTTERWYFGAPVVASAAASATANAVYYSPFWLPTRVTVAKVRFEIGASAGSCIVGIYDRSLKLLGSSATTATPASGAQSISLSSSLTLRPGLYYVAIQFSSASATFHFIQNNAGSFMLPVFKTEAGFGLPAGPVTGLSSVGSVFPKVGITGV